jgi:hypothetical protein
MTYDLLIADCTKKYGMYTHIVSDAWNEI